jgi:4-amino-4-deoxy-L-arabinose transferase-like glycosyltransferase
MLDAAPQTRATAWPAMATLAFWIELGLVLRVLAADLLQRLAARRGVRCLFPDTDVYWELARAIRAGGPYEIEQWGVPHFAIRTPGYPLFLALCQSLAGERLLPARLIQAAIGAGCIWIVYRLVRRIDAGNSPRRWSIALVAAALAALEPYTVGISVLLLSEALFLPLMLLSLWGLAALWSTDGAPRRPLVALATGAAFGAGVLTKPSWGLFPPLALLVWLAASRPPRAFALASLVVVGATLVMMPWWVRNAWVFGRFVPTAQWAGASLYDGLGPGATGASDMTFLDAPELQPLSEEQQETLLLRSSWESVRLNPARALRLAAVKAGRFWSPWPNAESVRSPIVGWLSPVAVCSLYCLMIAGAWDRRRDLRALVVLAGPLLYFAAVHMVFVSSVRYRIPGAVSALGLAAFGLSAIHARWIAGQRPRAMLASW